VRGAVGECGSCGTIARLLDRPIIARRRREALNDISRRLSGVLLATALLTSIATPAFGAPIDEKRAEAARIRSQVEALDGDLEIASEDYNEAKARYDAVTAEVKETEARLAALSARQETLSAHLGARARGMYRQGPLGALEMLLGAVSFEQLSVTWDLLQDMNQSDAATIAELKSVRAEVSQARDELAAQQAVAKAESDTMQARKAAVEKQLAERTRLLANVESEIATILREQEEAERRRAAQAAQAARAYTSPTNAPRSQVVQIALSKLGSPYQWAAAGPDRFDCSGFTMWVYARVGVSLPHSSRAQAGVGQRVSRADLAPGDLVFFGRPRIHHVGIYIGNGNYVHAPRTGDVVKVSSLAGRNDYVGATRP
jgi:cell wall-associated NlpC family hydrolase